MKLDSILWNQTLLKENGYGFCIFLVSLFVCEVVANSTVFLHLMRWVSPISVLIVLSSGFDLCFFLNTIFCL